MNNEEILQARKANLPNYLIRKGEQLERNGLRYRHKKHNSLVFTQIDSRWAYFWNSRNESGNAVDFLISFYSMDFKTAVNELIKFGSGIIFVTEKISDQQKKSFIYGDLVIEKDMRRTFAYLSKNRYIRPEIVRVMASRRLIYQQAHTNNIVFAVYDEAGNMVGGELEGTLSDLRFKGILEGTKYGYGFTVSLSKKADYLLFFESAVDLLSYIEIKIYIEQKELPCILVSMCGLKSNVVKHMININKARYGNIMAVLCVDADQAGDKFIRNLKNEMDIKCSRPPNGLKDWNDYLKSLKSKKLN